MMVAYASYTTAPEAMGSGLLVFGAGAVWGMRLIYRQPVEKLFCVSEVGVVKKGLV